MNLLIRADASVTMGTGHVMRCLALAQAWQDAGGSAVFGMAEATAGIQARLAAERCEAHSIPCAPGSEDDSGHTVAVARERKAEWVVIDGYQFGTAYQRALKAAGLRVLFVDDYGHAAHYVADLVLNQNAHAAENMYEHRESTTRLLLGPRYCLLRREFARWRGWKREIPRVGRKIVVTMGGSDPQNVTGTVIGALRELTDIEVIVVVGGSNPHWEELQQTSLDCGGRLQLKKGVTNMPELMARADLVVAGGGSTCWELCLLQVPMVLIDLAENQRPIAKGLEKIGAAFHLGSAGNVTAEQIATSVGTLLRSERERSLLSRSCGELVDGRGTERVLSELTRG